MTDTCRNCQADWSALQAERDRASRAIAIADMEVNRARARLEEVDAKIVNWQARGECRDHAEHRSQQP